MATYAPDMVRDNRAEHRFEIALDGGDVAAAYYERDEKGPVVLTHTEVPPEYGGQGIASALAQGVFDTARARGDKLMLKCAFMVAWFAKHHNYADVVAG